MDTSDADIPLGSPDSQSRDAARHDEYSKYAISRARDAPYVQENPQCTVYESQLILVPIIFFPPV